MKTNLYVLTALVILYFSVDVYLIIKLINIKKYPEKYAETELTKRANEIEFSRKHCRFFQSLSHQYGMVNFLFSILLSALSFLLVYLCSIINVEGKTGIFLGTAYFGACAAMFINIPLGITVIPLHIKTDFFAVSMLDMFNCEGRDKMFYRAYLFFTVLFILCFPFFTLGCNNYACYDDKGIYYSGYFQIDENYTKYEEVTSVSISIHHDNSGKVNVFYYYVTLNNGNSVNLNNPNSDCKYFTDNIYQIHKYLEVNKNCTFNITPLNETDIQFIESKLSEEKAAIVYYIFGYGANTSSYNL